MIFFYSNVYFTLSKIMMLMMTIIKIKLILIIGITIKLKIIITGMTIINIKNDIVSNKMVKFFDIFFKLAWKSLTSIIHTSVF